MKCRIDYDKYGNIVKVENQQGERSKLFDDLTPIIGKEKSLDIIALTETEDFQQSQAIKRGNIINKNKVTVLEQGRIFAESIGATPSAKKGFFQYTNGDSTYYFKSVGDKTLGDALLTTLPEKRGKGSAKLLMKDFLKKAGASGFKVLATLSPRDLSTKENLLKKLLLSLGYIEGATDFEMVRYPKKSDKIDTEESVNLPELISIPIEPSVEDALIFATRKEGVLSNEDILDVNNSLMNLGISSYGELINRFEKSLLKNGVMIFTQDTLHNTGLYNQYETNFILNNLESQNNIRRVYQALKNSENKQIESVDPMFIVATGEINSLGKQNILNPYLVEQEITKIIAGKDLAVSLDDIPYDIIKNNYNKFNQFKDRLDKIARENRNIPEKTIEFGELENKTTNNNRELFEKTLNLDSREALNGDIEYLRNISPSVWASSLDSVYELLKSFNKKSVNSGIDFLNIEDKAYTNSKEDIINLLDSFYDVLNSPSDNNLDYFFDTYSDFFSIQNEPVQQTVKTQNENSVFLDSSESEINLFKNFELIKESENVYRSISVIENVEDAYDILFSNKNLIPSNVETREDLVSYVNDLISDYQTSDFEMNMSDLENLIIHKLYFGLPLNVKSMSDNQGEARFTNIDANEYEYLTNVYPSDFYKNYIKEKRKNSDLFKNFYSKFTVNKKGIALLNNDPVTLESINPYIDEKLYAYNLLSKNLGLPIRIEDSNPNLDQMQYRREYAISNPDFVVKLKGDYMTLSPETIAVRNEKESFVKTPNGIYEFDYEIGDVSFYNKLPQGNEYYNSYGQHKIKTESSVDVREYGNLEVRPENFVRAKNYYSKTELQKINNKFFNC